MSDLCTSKCEGGLVEKDINGVDRATLGVHKQDRHPFLNRQALLPPRGAVWGQMIIINISSDAEDSAITFTTVRYIPQIIIIDDDLIILTLLLQTVLYI